MIVETCYACSATATGREHVPPVCLFPEQKDLPPGQDKRKALITVPSCAAHNNAKSADDEYLLFVLAANIVANERGLGQTGTKLVRAVARRHAGLIARAVGAMEEVDVVDSSTGAIHEAARGFLELRFFESLKLIGLGLYRHHYGKNWTGPLRAHADFIEVDGLTEGRTEYVETRLSLYSLAGKLFTGATRHGANPDVFWFSVVETPTQVECAMRLVFYGGATVTVFFGLTEAGSE